MGVFVELDDMFEDWLSCGIEAEDDAITIHQSGGKSKLGVIRDAKKVFAALYDLYDYIDADGADEYVDQQLTKIADQFSMVEIEQEGSRTWLKL